MIKHTTRGLKQDLKRRSKQNWEKQKVISSWDDTFSFERKDGKDSIISSFDEGFLKQWELTYGKVGNPKRRSFKTRTQALSFAKSYMRSHWERGRGAKRKGNPRYKPVKRRGIDRVLRKLYILRK